MRHFLIATAAFLLLSFPASAQGVFGRVFPWQITPIHMALMPDRTLITYGTDALGNQGAQMIYDVAQWPYDAAENQTVLLNTVQADIFCAAQALKPNGGLLIAGGSQTINSIRNYGRVTSYTYDPDKPMPEILSPDASMAFPRWYPSLIPLSDNRLAIFGGNSEGNGKSHTHQQAQITPEIYDPSAFSWQVEWGATSEAAFGAANNNDDYPRAFVIPGGHVVVITNDGNLFDMDLSGIGSITQLPGQVPAGDWWYPTVQYSPGHILLLRNNNEVVTIDFTVDPPAIADTSPVDMERKWSSMTLLANGKVLLTGGTAQHNVLIGVAHQALIWDPTTGQWSYDAFGTMPLSYHSNALLLPDGSVITSRGGAPNPVKPDGSATLSKLVAQIYYPDELFNSDRSLFAIRPALQLDTNSIRLGGILRGETDSSVSRVTMLQTGSATHSFNPGQRFLDVSFTQQDNNVDINIPSDPSIAVPGYYMVFVFNQADTPSISKIVHLVN